MSIKRCAEIFDLLAERNIEIEFDTPNGIRADRVERELLLKMKRTGCRFLGVAAESGNQDVLNNIVDKRLDLNSIVRISSECRRVGIPLKCYFVIGFPGETKKEIRETLGFALMLRREYKVRPRLSIATPYPGTRLYDRCKKMGYLVKEPTPEDLINATSPETACSLVKTEEFDPILLSRLYREFKWKLDLLDASEVLFDSNLRTSAFRYIRKKLTP